MKRKILFVMLITVSMMAFLAFLGYMRQITETDTDIVSTDEAVAWLYFPDVEEKPHESIVLMGDDLDNTLRYLNGIEFKDANGYPEEPLTEMYMAIDVVRGYTVTYIEDSSGQVWVYIDEDCLWVGVHQRGARMGGSAE